MAIGHWNDSVLDLIPAYRATRRNLVQARARAKAHAESWNTERFAAGSTLAEKAEAAHQSIIWETQGTLISAAIRDVEYVLEWLECGGNPERRRGVERRYERPWDPEWIDRHRSPSEWNFDREESKELPEKDRERIAEVMCRLSPRERQCFMLHVVEGMSYGDIARELHIARGTAQYNVEKAREKIECAKVSSLFLV